MPDTLLAAGDTAMTQVAAFRGLRFHGENRHQISTCKSKEYFQRNTQTPHPN